MSELVIKAEDFDAKVKKADGAVVVDFFADWCGPCKMLAPAVEKLAENYKGKADVYKLNIDNAQQIATQFGIRGVPTMIFFKGGQEKSRVVGNVPYEKLVSELNAVI